MGFHLSQSINARAFTYSLALPILLLYSLVLTGCISESPGIPNIFLIELIQTTGENTRLRINYLGICSIKNSSQDQFCSSTVSASPASLAHILQAPEAIIQYGLTLQHICFPVFLAASGVLFTFGIISFLMFKITLRAQHNPFDTNKLPRLPKRKARLSNAAQGPLWLSSAIALAVAYATTLSLASLSLAVSSTQPLAARQIIQRGTTLEVLQWLIFSLSFLFSLGISRLIRQTGLESVLASNIPGQSDAYPPLHPEPPPFGPPPFGPPSLGPPPPGPPRPGLPFPGPPPPP